MSDQHTMTSSPFDDELKRIQIETAKLDLAEREAKRRWTTWRRLLDNPVLLGTFVTAFLALNTVVGGLATWFGEIQRQNTEVVRLESQLSAEAERLQSDLALEKRKLETDLILKAIQTGNADQSRVNLWFLLRAGLISDPDGSIAMFLSEASPVMPPN